MVRVVGLGLIQNEHGVWCVRRKVPKRLEEAVARVQGAPRARQPWLKRSLRTKDEKRAKVLAKPVMMEFDRILAQAEALLVEQPVRTSLTEAEIKAISDYLYAHELGADQELREEGVGSDPMFAEVHRQLTEAGVEFATPFEVSQASSGLSDRMMHKIEEETSIVLPAVKQALARGNVDFIRYELHELLQLFRINLDPNCPDFRKLALAVMGAEVRALEAIQSRHQADPIESPKLVEPGATSAPASGGCPLNEQRRIVARINQVSAKSKRASENLDNVSRLVETYKQAILTAAFRGDLTSEWRANDPVLSFPWRSVSLSEVASIGTGSTPKRGNPRYYSKGKIPWVTSGAVNNPVVTSADEIITETAIRETNCKVFPSGTILMAMYGEGQTRGRVAVLAIAAATNQALAAIQIPADGPVLRDFVLWHLRSGYLHLREQAAGGVQPNLNLGMIKAWRLPLPSKAEQQEIVRRIGFSFDWITRLASEATKARELIEHFEQMVLRKAFEGQLVLPDIADEPIGMLAEALQAERRKKTAALRFAKTARGKRRAAAR